jgi:hypothetical protein
MNYKLIAESIKKTIIGRKTKSLIAALLLAASSAFAQVPSYVPTNGLVGWWPFNGNANDESGNGNNGIVNGATLTTDRLGNANKAYSFDGINDYIRVSNFNPLLNNSFTISLWVKVISNNNYQVFLSKGPKAAGHFEVYSFYQTNKLSWNTNDMCQNIQSNFTITDNFFHNIVVVQNNNIVSFFIDNSLQGQFACTGSIQNFINDLTFGKIDDPFPYFSNGKIDDIAIWNRALSQQEITNVYNAQNCNGSLNTITADSPTTFCAGNFVNLTSNVSGATYQWRRNGINITTNGTSKTFKATSAGSYTCVATCNGTALTSNAIAVTSKTNASATVSASGATSFCAGDSVTLNATNLGSNYSVQWYRTNVSMENATNYSIVVKQPGTYKVVTKNLTTGCSRISGSAITTSVNCLIAGDVTSGSIIQENTNVDGRFIDNELSQGVHVFPNPNSGVFSFNYDGEETGDAVLQIINNMGQSIYQSRISVPEGGFTQDLQLGDNITKGIYIVRLLINNSYHDSKVIVK